MIFHEKVQPHRMLCKQSFLSNQRKVRGKKANSAHKMAQSMKKRINK